MPNPIRLLRLLRPLPLFMLSLLLLQAGCTTWTHVRVTGADERILYIKDGMICAEPSPDVAKAVQTSLELAKSLTASVKGARLPVDGKLEIAGSLSRSQAEALAQLTERLATIQLLRDGLYRACEASINGLLDKTSYAVALSRFDDVMVTMLASELIAGNHGRELAALGGSANGRSNASLAPVTRMTEEVQAATERLAALRQQSATEREEVSTAGTSLASCEKAASDLQKDCAPERQVVQTERGELEASEQAERNAMADAIATLRSAAESSAQALVFERAGAPLAGRLGDDRNRSVDQISKIQQRYIENANVDAFVVACVTELAHTTQDEEKPSKLAGICERNLGPISTLTALLVREKSAGGPSRLLEACSEAIDSLARAGSQALETRTTEKIAEDQSSETEIERFAEPAILTTITQICSPTHIDKLITAQNAQISALLTGLPNFGTPRIPTEVQHAIDEQKAQIGRLEEAVQLLTRLDDTGPPVASGPLTETTESLEDEGNR